MPKVHLRDETNPALPRCMVRRVRCFTEDEAAVTCKNCPKVHAKREAARLRWEQQYGQKETRR